MKGKRERPTHLLVRDPLARVVHEALDGREVHLLVELLEDLAALLQAVQDVLLDERVLYRLDLRARAASVSEGPGPR